MRDISREDLSAVQTLVQPRGGVSRDAAATRRAVEDERTKVYGRLRFAVLNAIPHEYAAILAVFGEERSIPSREHVDSSIKYVTIPLTSGDEIYVVLAGITGQGIAQAAAAAAQVKYKCRHVNKIILVGIAAGQPNLDDKEKDVRLGDIVVGNRVIQYDHVKVTKAGVELRGGNLAPGASTLMTVVDRLRARQEFTNFASQTKAWIKYIEVGTASIRNAGRPSPADDVHHNQRNYTKGLEYERSENEPYVHVGTIGSASTLLKCADRRDDLKERYGTIAYEMEGAGLAIAAAASGVEYLMVRGICDYGDEHKNDKWQTYASVCAAAFARAVLEAQ